MFQETKHQLPTQIFPKKSSRFLGNKNQPGDGAAAELNDEAAKELEAEILLSWYHEKRGFRRYAKKLRQSNA